MEQAWIIMGETYLLTIVISLFVAFLIHMMTLLIRRFGTAAKPLPVSAEQVEISKQPDDPDELAALAIAIATTQRGGGPPQTARRGPRNPGGPSAPGDPPGRCSTAGKHPAVLPLLSVVMDATSPVRRMGLTAL